MPNWNEVLQQISNQRHGAAQASQRAIDLVRHQYLSNLHVKTGRNIIAYYSGFLSKPGVAQQEINDEDKAGFMTAIHKLDKSKGLDLFLHTPGGSIAATESIVNYLHKIFGTDIRAVVPQIAMSAGTMIACCCKSILMAKHSNLGPIDPHLAGAPAYGVIDEFKRAIREIKRDPSKVHVWQPIIQQYRPTFLGQCQNAITWSKQFVEEHLQNVMFKGEPAAKNKSRRITRRLLDYKSNKAHNRHIHIEECEKIGLKIEKIEDDAELQDLILTVHHCYMHALMNTPSFKIIENHTGIAFIKHQVMVQQVSQQPG